VKYVEGTDVGTVRFSSLW